MISSYPSIFNFGHKAIETLTDYPVIIEEKVDGSQFSFMRGEDGIIHFRSKGAEIYFDGENCNQKMFTAGCRAVWYVRDNLHPGWIYRGEYLSKNKHNALVYDRVPRDNR